MASWVSRLLFGPEGPSLEQADGAGIYGATTRDVWEIPALIAGRQLIADTLANMQLVAHDGRRRIDPTPTLLRRPDPREPYRRTIERFTNALVDNGRVWYAITSRLANDYPASIQVIDDQRVSYVWDDTRQRLGSVTIDGRDVDLRTVRYLPFIVTDRHPMGVSPVQLAEPVLRDLVGVYSYAADYYNVTAPLPPYALTTQTRLNGTASRDLADQWIQARRERRPAVLTGDLGLETFNPTTAAEAVIVDAQNQLDAAIARTLSIPPSLLNVTSNTSLTYSTTVGELRRWLSQGLTGYVSRLEAAFSDLLPRGQSAQFDTSSLVRMDFAARIDTLSTSIAAGIHTPAEARALEGLPATPDRDPNPIAANVEGL